MRTWRNAPTVGAEVGRLFKEDNAMISEQTRKAICALLAIDERATPQERERVAEAMAGEPVDAVATLTIAEACKRLGCSRTTIWRRVNSGKLTGIPGEGEARNIRWVTRESVERLLMGK